MTAETIDGNATSGARATAAAKKVLLIGCRAAGRKRDAHRVLGRRRAFPDYGIIRPLSLPPHEKTPRSLAACDRGVQVE